MRTLKFTLLAIAGGCLVGAVVALYFSPAAQPILGEFLVRFAPSATTPAQRKELSTIDNRVVRCRDCDVVTEKTEEFRRQCPKCKAIYIVPPKVVDPAE